MRHLQDIEALVKTLRLSDTFHALVVESPPGWAKSTTIERVLKESSTQFTSIGSYSTPLSFYNELCRNPSGILVLDDSAGLLGDPIGMAILKAATWPSAGSDGERRVTWQTTSERVSQPSIVFFGKLILLTNHVPKGAEATAFLSRALHLLLSFSPQEISEMFRAAALDTEHFEDTHTAKRVAEYLLDFLQSAGGGRLSLRTLKMGYEVARANPNGWEETLAKLLPGSRVRELLLASGGKGSEQRAREFSRTTGLSRRSFYYLRKRLRDSSVKDQCNLHRSVLGPRATSPSSSAVPDDCSQFSGSGKPKSGELHQEPSSDQARTQSSPPEPLSLLATEKSSA